MKKVFNFIKQYIYRVFYRELLGKLAERRDYLERCLIIFHKFQVLMLDQINNRINYKCSLIMQFLIKAKNALLVTKWMQLIINLYFLILLLNIMMVMLKMKQ